MKQCKAYESDVLLARQAIYSTNHEIYGFELLYRGERFDVSAQDNGMAMTVELLNNIFTSIHDDNLTLNKPCFINVDQTFIESPSFFPSQSDNIVLEILETVPATQEVLNKIKKLQKAGFQFALDDFLFEEDRMAFLPYVSIVKIDVIDDRFQQVKDKISLLKKYNVTLLAEKVESMAVFDECKSLGFTLFQGYHLERPKLIHGKKVPTSKQVTVNLISELSREDISTEKVSELIVCDPRLAMKLLLLANSSAYSFVRKIDCLKDAIVALGIDAVKRWAVILLLIAESDAPVELIRLLLSRAKTLELYAKNAKLSGENDFFILGLFSGLDAILGVELSSIIDSLSLKQAVKEALIEEKGQMADALDVVKSIERYDPSIDSDKASVFIKLNQSYWQSIVWADELMTIIHPDS